MGEKKKIKEILLKINTCIITFLSRLWPIFLFKLLNYYRVNFYSEWVKRSVQKCGKSVVIAPSCIIKGNSICIGNNSTIGRGCIITAWNKYESYIYNPEINIGSDCTIGEYNHITSINGIKIGRGVLTGRWVTITDNSHGNNEYKDLYIDPIKRPVWSKGKVVIGDRVWIGDKATILPGVILGDGCIVAANSVVTKSFPSNTIIGGNPAIIIKSIDTNQSDISL